MSIIFLVAGQLGNCEMTTICQITLVFKLQPRTQQYYIIPAFNIPTVDENGHFVNKVYTV